MAKPKYDKRMQQFWKYNLHPVLGYHLPYRNYEETTYEIKPLVIKVVCKNRYKN